MGELLRSSSEYKDAKEVGLVQLESKKGFTGGCIGGDPCFCLNLN